MTRRLLQQKCVQGGDMRHVEALMPLVPTEKEDTGQGERSEASGQPGDTAPSPRPWGRDDWSLFG